MDSVYVRYNPYRLETVLKVNGRPPEHDSSLLKTIGGKRLQEWIGSFPEKLVEELNCVDLNVEFYGMRLDWDDFEEAFRNAQKSGIIRDLELRFTEGRSDEDINRKITDIFTDLKEGPVDDFRDQRLIRIFNDVNNAIFPINVVATMSSGKSTLINSLLRKKLMPYKNEACTAVITEILDNDLDFFTADAYDAENDLIENIPDLTYEIMDRLNSDERVSRICAKGDIPFLDSKNTALQLVDTPGPNNAQNQNHKNITYSAIQSEANNLILYVLNGTQLSTNDDDNLLSYVSEQINKGGKQARDRFLFVINKMDSFDPENESIEKAVASARKYLSAHGINDPQIFPCSAKTALLIRTLLKDIDLSRLTMAEFTKLPTAVKETYASIEKFNGSEDMHLEKYSTLSPSAQSELYYRLKKAEETGDIKEQALIHSGICSIEAAITAYVKKYARTKKVKDLVESFIEVLNSNCVLARAKDTVSRNEDAAKACILRADAIRKKIADGAEAAEFKAKIDSLDPMPFIEEKAEALTDTVERKTSRIFSSCGEIIENRTEAMRLVNSFTALSSDIIAEMSAELESIIKSQIIDTGEGYLEEYREKLTRIDEAAGDMALDFSTVDLVKGAMLKMREFAQSQCSADFAGDTVDDLGVETVEERTYYEKVGEKEEQVWIGEHQEFVKTEQVKVGSHREVVGSHRIKNPERSGFFGFFKIWEPRYIEVNDYRTVDDYEDRDVYKTVQDFATVMRDIMEERTEKIVKYSVKTADIQMGLVSQLRENLDDGVKTALSYAREQVVSIKEQFGRLFAELDALIEEKYDELNSYSDDQKTNEEELKKNRGILNWIEGNIKEINDIIEI